MSRHSTHSTHSVPQQIDRFADADFRTRLFACNPFGLQTLPEFLRENKIILVSSNVPKAVPSLNASRKEDMTVILL